MQELRRATQEATDEAIAYSMENDSAGRREALHDFAEIIDLIVGNYSIFLDARWGTGKTFFVRQMCLALRDTVCDAADARTGNQGISATLGLKGSHLPVYFNAWENDYRDEPVLSLVATMVEEFDELKGWEKLGPDAKGAALGLLRAASINLPFVSISPSSVPEDFAVDVIEPLRRDRSIRELLGGMLQHVLAERAERIVLFIDELDRCRPIYAVRLLEAIKFLFDDERLTIVFSVDHAMLAKAVRGCYGEGFNGEEYLSRFYDMKFVLPQASPERRLRMAGFDLKGDGKLWETARAVLEGGSLSLRDQLKFVGLLEAYFPQSATEGVAPNGLVYVRNVLGPMALACSMSNPGVFEAWAAPGSSRDEWTAFWNECEGNPVFYAETERLGEVARSLGMDVDGDPEVLFIYTLQYELRGMEDDDEEKTNVLGLWQYSDNPLGELLGALNLG